MRLARSRAKRWRLEAAALAWQRQVAEHSIPSARPGSIPMTRTVGRPCSRFEGGARPLLARDEQELGAAVGDDVAHLGRRQRRVEGHRHGADQVAGEVDDVPLGPVLGEQRDPVALRHPGRGQARRRLSGAPARTP